MLFPNTFIITTSTVLPKSHKAPDSYINVTVDFGADVGMIPLNSIVEKTQAYKLKQRITYKLINKYILPPLSLANTLAVWSFPILAGYNLLSQ